MSEKSVKPKFDKKKWRTEKYSKKVRGNLVYTDDDVHLTSVFKSLFFKKKNLPFPYFTLILNSIVDQWQEKRKKYIQGKYFRMLQKEGLSKNNPNLEPLNSEKAK